MRPAVPVAFLLVSAALAAPLQTNPAASAAKLSDAETGRLIATAKLWATVKFFHPYLAYRDIDWDRALVRALPEIRSAQTGAAYALALESMLDVLADPASYVTLDAAPLPNTSVNIDVRPGGVFVVSESVSPAPAATAQHVLAAIVPALSSARTVLFDLRAAPGQVDVLSSALDNPSIAKILFAGELTGPAERSWMHNGLPSPVATADETDGYYSAFLTKPGARFTGSSSRPPRLGFLLNENAPLPRVASALLAAGKADVMAASAHYQFAGAAATFLPMGEGVVATVRLSEPLAPRVVHPVKPASAIADALTILAAPESSAPLAALPIAPMERVASALPDPRYPSVEYRFLAACKIWAVLHNFFAYRDLMDEDWDDVFARYLPRFLAAKDARDYHLTAAEMLTHSADSHTTLESAELDDFFGPAPVGLRLQLIEKKAVVTQILDPSLASAGLHVGDILTAVDGEAVSERFRREARYISSSTPQALAASVMARLLNGPDGSQARLTTEDAAGAPHQVTCLRNAAFSAQLAVQRSGEAVAFLPGNLGYVDLDRLLPNEVDAMFDRLRSARAIIFDLRGQTRGAALSLAPRLVDRPAGDEAPAAAIINGPLTLTPDLASSGMNASASYFFVQKLPPSAKWKYSGKTVLLIDGRTRGQSEHTALCLEAANRSQLIGSASAGAIGDVSRFAVPGGITVAFSGHDVRQANGGAIQRLGLQPAVDVSPTITGIRNGADEVLQRAIEELSPASQKADLSPRSAPGNRNYPSGHPGV